MTRQVVLDTETTGLSPDEGHRIIEIGCVEILNRRLTRSRFHVYLNPDRQIDQGAIDVHGLDNAFLADKPRFCDVVSDFLDFIRDSELIIHNAAFDVGFINHELRLLGHGQEVGDLASVLDTLALARKKHPGQRNNLDALCKRYNVDNSRRDLHGALLDAEILAEVYLAMTGGQSSLMLEPEPEPDVVEVVVNERPRVLLEGRPALKVLRADEIEASFHERRLVALDKSSGGRCVWRSLTGSPTTDAVS